MNRILLIYFLGLTIAIASGCKGFKWQGANDIDALQYYSIDESKENNAFVVEYVPQKSYLEIDGKKFNIDRAWIEKAHYMGNFRDILADDVRCFVMTLKNKPDKNIELSDYIPENGNGNDIVWFFLEPKFNSDTIELKYCHSLKHKMNDILLLFKKSTK